MPYTITFDLPNLSKGQGVAITGLGEFKNGQTYTISDADHETYRIVNTTQTDGENGVVTSLGPTLLQTKFPEGVTVEKSKAAEEKKGDDK